MQEIECNVPMEKSPQVMQVTSFKEETPVKLDAGRNQNNEQAQQELNIIKEEAEEFSESSSFCSSFLSEGSSFYEKTLSKEEQIVNAVNYVRKLHGVQKLENSPSVSNLVKFTSRH